MVRASACAWFLRYETRAHRRANNRIFSPTSETCNCGSSKICQTCSIARLPIIVVTKTIQTLKLTSSKLRVVPKPSLRSSASNRLITAKDHAAVQINIGQVDENGVLNGEFDTIAISGYVRRKGLSDDAFFRIAREKGYVTESK